MPLNGVVTPYDDAGYPAAATHTAALTYAGGVVKSQPGRLCKVVVTTTFAGSGGLLSFYDNASGAASGTPLFTIPTGAAAGTVYTLDLPVAAGVSVVNSGMTAGAVTIGYA